MEEHKEERKAAKRIIIAVVAAGLLAAATVFYFFFPTLTASTLKKTFQHTAAVIAQSWDDTFGMPQGNEAMEIDLQNSATSTDAQSTSTQSEEDIAQVVPPSEAEAQTQGSPETTAMIESTETTESLTQSSSLDIAFTADADTNTNSALVASQPSSTALCDPAILMNPPASPSRKVILNEIAWMGSVPLAGETATKAADREWIELKNISGNTVDLTGWQMLDTAGNLKILFGSGEHLAAGAFYLLARGSGNASATVPGVPVDKSYSGALSNAGDGIVLFGAGCDVSDLVNASSGWSGGDNSTKQTLERNADGGGWHTSVPLGGTPRVENSVPAVATGGGGGGGGGGSSTTGGAGATDSGSNADNGATSTTSSCTNSLDHLVIAEVQVGGAASTNDFVKIFNPTAAAMDVSGWKLRKKSKTGTDYSLRTFPDGSSVPAGGYFIWANSVDNFGISVNANVVSSETLAADNSVALMDVNGAVVDMVAWGTGTSQYVEGFAYPTDPEANQVLKRKSSGGAMQDTDSNANDFSI